ncbi:MAG: hypothetical protein EXR35_10660 [Limnohabitans sp.]|nr:hypothetical protein [Limnohabitans sp.]
MDSKITNQPISTPFMTGGDKIFLLLMIVVLALTSFIGLLAYKDAMKIEITKKNGEAWVEWLTKVSEERMNPKYEISACNSKSGDSIESAVVATPSTPSTSAAPTPSTSKPDESTAASVQIDGTWGACLNHIMNNTEIKDLINPFTNQSPKIVAQCQPSDRSLVGAIVLEKIVPTPPGSAVPTTNSQFVDNDSIENKILIRITVCDKGAYPVRVAEVEF